MAKITPRDPNANSTIFAKTKASDKNKDIPQAWWKAKNQDEMAAQLCSTASFLKEQQQYRYRQAALYARLYSNYPLFGGAGMSFARFSLSSQLPSDRPTLNVVQSCVDTLHSRIIQSKPRPIFLTDNGDYKQRNIAKKLNNFISGEFYQTKAYELGEDILRDAFVSGTGCVKILEKNKKVALERRFLTEILVDPNDAMYGDPRQMYELQLMDRGVAKDTYPDYKSVIDRAEQAFVETGADSSKTISDQIMIVEGWHLPSGPDATDGVRMVACTAGSLGKEKWTKQTYPFVFDHYSKRILGFWSQGLPEQLMGTQVEINKLLMTISSAINLVGVPRVFVEDGSHVVKAHLNNQVGSIVTYRGTKPQYEVAPCIPQEVYAQLERLVQYAYQQSGISALAATSQKPAGLNSGEAIRNYDDLQTDRFAYISKKYERFYEDLAEQIFDKACEIAERDGKYSTIYPSKNGTKVIDLPKISKEKDPYVIQCFDISSLPRDPAGRLQKITEMVQSGMIDIREGRRLLDYPDLEQVETLANASEERILKILDEIVEEGKYTPPDGFMDLELADKLSVQYYNLYAAAKLEPEKEELLRTFSTQVKAFKQQMMQPPPAMAQPQGGAIGVPQARPVADLMPMMPTGVPGAA